MNDDLKNITDDPVDKELEDIMKDLNSDTDDKAYDFPEDDEDGFADDSDENYISDLRKYKRRKYKKYAIGILVSVVVLISVAYLCKKEK